LSSYVILDFNHVGTIDVSLLCHQRRDMKTYVLAPSRLRADYPTIVLTLRQFFVCVRQIAYQPRIFPNASRAGTQYGIIFAYKTVREQGG
jgi:hypothetical protein